MADDRLVELISELLIETKAQNQRIDSRFERMDERFERMEERFERMDGRLEKLELQQIRTNFVLEGIQKTLEEVLDRLDFDNVHYDTAVDIELDGTLHPGIIRRKKP
ncbi:MAG: hypothetical protein SFY70_03380 [Bacteroidia bacterium]|nr:hypothetical protein [Bacteroidia bacterium]